MLINGLGRPRNINDIITQARSSVSENLKRLSSGKKLNSTDDDPAAMASSERLQAELASHGQAGRNISYGTSLTTTADAAMGQQGELLGRMRKLAVEGASGTLDNASRAAINQEFNALREEFDRVAATTEHNGQPLLQGGDVQVQVGINGSPSDRVDFELPDTQAATLGLGAVDLTSQAEAINGISSLDNAITDFNAGRAELGSNANRLGFSDTHNEMTTQNKTSAVTTLRDTDVAEEISALNLNRFRAHVAIKSKSIEKEGRGGLLDLIR